jgi:aldehyde:ferredoxin oxidoreductase
MGGHFAAELKQCGIDGIIITGKAAQPAYLRITDTEAIISDATKAWGQEVSTAAKWINSDSQLRHPEGVFIGPAGENQVYYAAIISHGRLSGTAAGRTGMGAVMGSKNLKAIIARGKKDVTIANIKAFTKVNDEIIQIMKEEPNTQLARDFGTSFLVEALDQSGTLVTHNFQKGKFDGVDQITGYRMRKEYLWKAQACQSCYHACTRYIHIDKGMNKGLAGKGPEFETLGAFGSNVGIGDLEAILALNLYADELGVDTISAGVSVSFAQELWQRGLLTEEDTNGLELRWGDVENIKELLRRIAYREGIGDILANGVRKAAKIIGRGSAKYAMHTKGLEVIVGDPRGQTGFTLGYTVCNRGSDHLGALPIFDYLGDKEKGKTLFGSEEAADRFGVKGKGRLVRFQEDLCAIIDSLNVCKSAYAHYATNYDKILGLSFERLSRLYEAATGIPLTTAELAVAGERIINLDRMFNVREGLRREDDSLPERFLKTPLEEGAAAGRTVNLEPMLNEYYEARGWDQKTGIPLAETLRRVGLSQFIPDLPSK